MTGEELIKKLEKLGKDTLKKDVVMFNCGHYCTPFKVEIMDVGGGYDYMKGRILIE